MKKKDLGVNLNKVIEDTIRRVNAEMDRAISSAGTALGFRQKRVTFKQAERKLFSLMAAAPRFTPSTEAEHMQYFRAVVHPYARLAILINAANGISAEIKSRPRRIAEIRNEARKLADAAGMDARAAI